MRSFLGGRREIQGPRREDRAPGEGQEGRSGEDRQAQGREGEPREEVRGDEVLGRAENVRVSH